MIGKVSVVSVEVMFYSVDEMMALREWCRGLKAGARERSLAVRRGVRRRWGTGNRVQRQQRSERIDR